ncbi:MAG: carbamoyltransferase [Rhodospirillales bacterium]|nr:carbamoyltransferase [Rhodospirillales bacterium]
MKATDRAVLSLSLSYDSGAAVFVDGKLIAAVGEERLNRKKNTRAFPVLSILECLSLANLRPSDIGLVLLASRITPNWISLKFPKFHELESVNLFSPMLYPVVAEQWLARKSGLIGLEAAMVVAHTRSRLRKLGILAPCKTFDHHRIHARCAYSAASFDQSLVVTMDAMGDGISSGVYLGDNGGLTPIGENSGFATPAFIYSQVTQLLGFTPSRHEGKITGLAAYGDAETTLPLFRRIMACEGGRFRTRRISRPNHPLYAELMRHRPEDIAAGVQRRLEEVVTAYVRHWLTASGRRHLALAGGVFANVKLNQRLAEIEDVERIFVFPHMGDGGLPVGAGYEHFGAAPSGLDTIYLGRDFSDRECQDALRGAGLPFTQPTDMADAVSALLAEGKTVGRCAGRMEYGPRALGNRSIMASANDPSINDWLNKKLRRTEFMPFAPSTLDEQADRYYRNLSKARECARYMTITFDCTPESRERQRGCVHVDGTARPQLVRAEDNPGYHAIIRRYFERTGAATLVNTSFNVHEEPIVASPQDAIKSFKDCGLDGLILGPYLAAQVSP